MYGCASPFLPGAVAAPELFAGRTKERLLFEEALIRAEEGASSCIVVCGECGLGKSSLASITSATAEGRQPSLTGHEFSCVVHSFGFLPEAHLSNAAASITSSLAAKDEVRTDYCPVTSLGPETATGDSGLAGRRLAGLLRG